MPDKSDIRARAREARRAIAPAERAAAAAAIASRALAVPGVVSARTVLGYVATAEEIDPALLLDELRRAGARIALPRVSGPMRLTLHWVSAVDELVAGAFGILEPAPESPAAEPAEIDLALVPGVAFDEGCRRIGYGGGFYDRLLPLLRPGAVALGLAFDVQVVNDVPAEAHDVSVDMVVTPERVVVRT